MSTKLLGYVILGQNLPTFNYALSDTDAQNSFNAGKASFNGRFGVLSDGTNVQWARIYTPYPTLINGNFYNANPADTNSASNEFGYSEGDAVSAFVWHDQFVNPVAASSTYVLSAFPLTAATQLVLPSAFAHIPANARRFTFVGSASGIVGSVVITGTEAGTGNAIGETITLNGTSSVKTTLAYASIQFTLPIQTHAGTDTVSVGVGAEIGLSQALTNANLLIEYSGGVVQTATNTATDAATIVTNTRQVSLNWIIPSVATIDGAHNLDLYYVVG